MQTEQWGKVKKNDKITSNPVNHLAGKIVDHGKAPYAHDPENKDNYYITLENADSRQSTIWGIDLERALSESSFDKGDSVVLENLGSRKVTVEQPVKDKQGNIVSIKTISTHRNEWAVKALSLDNSREPVRQPNELGLER
jgi:putative DNA primase/helicase